MATTKTQVVILVVDDDPILRESIVELLELEDYDCLAAANGIEALDMMRQRLPDLIIADIMMPKMDGYEFYQAVREHAGWALIPFIFLSAKGEQKDIRRGYQLGADRYITKPFELEDLLIAIQSRLQRMADMRAATLDGVEQMRRSFLEVIGHELRTPLTFIYGYLGLFEERKDQISKENMAEFLQGMRRGTDRLINLVEDLMLLATIDSGAVEQEIIRYSQPVDLGVVLEEVLQTFSPQATDHNISTSWDVPPDSVIWGIPIYMRDIFKRLIDNAIKFSKPGGGEIWARADPGEDGQVRISIQDTGIGISPEWQAAIFERFQQIDRKKMEQQGLGLGLTIAYQLVRLHGGDIQVESQLGEGTTIIVSLPTGKA